MKYTIPVHTAPAYDVTVGSGLLRRSGTLLHACLPLCRVAVITDSNVAPLYLAAVEASLREAGYEVCSFVFPAGEQHKNIAVLSDILEFLARERLSRSDCVVALGGGVVGDMAGFAAGCFLRGIRCVQMPTTLLAAVDSSVGGKTAIDLTAGKNLAGVFLQPAAVLCDIDCLTTLPQHAWNDGVAEAIKTAVLSDASLFSLFEDGCERAATAELIARCVRYKAGVVERDEKEQNERRLLNLGHTVGHAIERCSNYTVSHGHAVAAGLAIMARAAASMGWTTQETARRICTCLAKNQLPVSCNYSAEELSAAALMDKKRSGTQLTVVVPERIGDCTLRTVSVDALPTLIAAGLEE